MLNLEISKELIKSQEFVYIEMITDANVGENKQY